MRKGFFNRYHPVSEKNLNEYNACRPSGPQPVLCYAPFRNLFFNPDGRVIACSYQRNFTLGTYPEQRLREIWNGRPLKTLRKYILKNDLSLSCYVCQNYLESGRYDGVRASMYDEMPNAGNYPSVMEFNIDNTCNLECVMCIGELSSKVRQNREKKAPLRSPYDNAFVEQLTEFIPHLTETKFYGGEPFLIPLYYDIWEKIIALNPRCRITIQTNATVMNDKVRNLLGRANVHINVSLDAVTPHVYESIRKGARYETVQENLRYFAGSCRKNNRFFGITAQIMQHNWKELPLLVDFCNAMDIPLYLGTVWFPLTASLWNLDPERLSQIEAYLKQASFSTTGKTAQANIAHYNSMIRQIELWRLDAGHRREAIVQNLKLPVADLEKNLESKVLAQVKNEKLPTYVRNERYDICLSRLKNSVYIYRENDTYTSCLSVFSSVPSTLLLSWLEGEAEAVISEIFLSSDALDFIIGSGFHAEKEIL